MPQLYICPYCKKTLLSSTYHMYYHVDQECIYNKKNKNKNNICVNNNEQEVKQEKSLQKKEI